MDVCERACVLPSLFYNAFRCVSQSASHSEAGEEERKLADRLRYNPMHYSCAVRERITIQTSNDLQVHSAPLPCLRSLQTTGNIRTVGRQGIEIVLTAVILIYPRGR